VSGGRLVGVLLAAVVTGLAVARPLEAQTFAPPPVQPEAQGTSLGLFGFGVRAGMTLKSAAQVALGATLDLGDLRGERVRLRASGDLGVGHGADTYVGSLEALYRLTGGAARAVPYVGAGPGVGAHSDCGGDAHCPALWFSAVVGVEIRYRAAFNWLVEYHGVDLFREGRLYVGLTTRRGG